jgi:hypothetical protein
MRLRICPRWASLPGCVFSCAIVASVSSLTLAIGNTAPLRVWANPAQAQAGAGRGAQIRFTFENPKLQPAKYVITVNADGSGHYTSQIGNAAFDQAQFPVRNQDRPIQISPATRDAIFAAARHNNYFAIPCEGGGGRIAFQGTKTLEYIGDDGRGSCTYNWSKSSQIEEITSKLESISLALEEGAKLEVEYEHSRLSLDAELESLSELAHDGRAIELGNIAPILKKIADDEAVLNRAQRRARELLAAAESGQ